MDTIDRVAPGILEEALEHALESIVLLRPIEGDDGRLRDVEVLYANRAARSRWAPGLGADKVRGAILFDALPVLRPFFLDIYAGVYASGMEFHGEVTVEGPSGALRVETSVATFVGGLIHTSVDRTRRWHAERELAESNERYRILAEGASDVVVRASNDGTMEWVSPSIAAATGWAPVDLVGRPFLDIVHPEDRAAVIPVHHGLLRGESAHIEVRILMEDGSWRWFRIAVRPHFGRGGKVIGRVAGWQDVDAEVRARRELLESEARFRVMVERASDVVMRSEVGGRITWASATATHATGWRPEQLAGRSYEEFVHPDDLALLAAARPALDEGTPIRRELRFACADGRHRWFRASFHPEVDARGYIVGRVSGWQDIDAEVAAREALAASEVRFRTTIEALLDPVILFHAVRDADGGIADFRFAYVNEAVCAVTGTDRDALTERRISEVFPAESARMLAGRLAQVVETGEPLIVDAAPQLFDRGPGEVPRILDIRGVRLGGDGVVVALRDVTDAKAAAERLAEASRLESLGRLSAGVAHEFGNLLTGIGLAAEWIADNPGDVAVAEEAQGIRGGVDRGAELVRAFRTFVHGQPTGGGPADAAEIVRETEPLLRALVGGGIGVVLDLPEGLPTVVVRREGLSDALVELATNARDAMPSGGTLRISLEACDLDARAAAAAQTTPGPCVALSVADTGAGIDPAVLPRVFEPLFTTKPRPLGTGLGLAVVHGFAAAHGAGVAIETRVGQGTTVRLYLRPAPSPGA